MTLGTRITTRLPSLSVRSQDATKQFIDVGNLPTDYKPLFGCVSGTDHGAMGIHYVDLGLVGDGEIDLRHPEAVIYEPVGSIGG